MSDIREIKVPALGESITEASVVRWLKQAGDAVEVDETLLELETEKITLEIASPATGTLQEIIAPAGTTVTVGKLLGLVSAGAAAPKRSSASSKTKAAPPPAAKEREQAMSLSPAVRKAVKEKGVNPAQIEGTGKKGRITKEDVIAFAEQEYIPEQPHQELPSRSMPEVTRFPSSSRREERVRMSKLRQKIAERLKYAQNTAAILTTFNEVDMTQIQLLRARYKESFEKKHGIKLGFMSFFVKASLAALKEFPAVNAEIDGEEIIYKEFFDIGVAVSTPQGLVVPVIRDADQLTFAGIETTLALLSNKARENKLTMEDLKGGTFTVSNGGIFGSLMSTPILNPPQSGILGMHKIQDRPVVIDGKIEIRPMMYVALSYDHRIIDGREAVSFLVRIKESIENPERLLLDL